ncbi:MAG: hypothetical protein U5L11_10690 [Arhodomonas sp.]|nr:hypothetical protein [Arhodomonas sp.]
MEFTKLHNIRFAGDPYNYARAFGTSPSIISNENSKVVLDPTAGGGSIPFEALRLGHTTIANELNPVACVVLQATLQYPLSFGPELVADVKKYGTELIKSVENNLKPFFALEQPIDTGPNTPNTLQDNLAEPEIGMLRGRRHCRFPLLPPGHLPPLRRRGDRC